MPSTPLWLLRLSRTVLSPWNTIPDPVLSLTLQPLIRLRMPPEIPDATWLASPLLETRQFVTEHELLSVIPLPLVFAFPSATQLLITLPDARQAMPSPPFELVLQSDTTVSK